METETNSSPVVYADVYSTGAVGTFPQDRVAQAITAISRYRIDVKFVSLDVVSLSFPGAAGFDRCTIEYTIEKPIYFLEAIELAKQIASRSPANSNNAT